MDLSDLNALFVKNIVCGLNVVFVVFVFLRLCKMQINKLVKNIYNNNMCNNIIYVTS
jgi:hypothetical protein